jgi:hypothetical protein
MTPFIDGGFERGLASSDSNQPYAPPVCPRILQLFRTYDFSLIGKDKKGATDGELEGNGEDEGFVSILGNSNGWQVSLLGSTDDENDDMAGNTDGDSNDVDNWCIPVLCSTGSIEP